MLRKTTARKAPEAPVSKPKKKKSSSFDCERFKEIQKKFWIGLVISMIPLLVTLLLEYTGKKSFVAFWVPERTVFLCLTLTVSAMLDGMLRKEKCMVNWSPVHLIVVLLLMGYYVLLAVNDRIAIPFFNLTDYGRGLVHFTLLISTITLCTLSYLTNCLKKEERK